MKGKFLVVQYAGKPADPSQTSKKGYLKENLVYDEKVSLTTSLRDKDFISATVVLDLENKKILRRSKIHDISDSYDFLYEYYYKNYKEHINKFLGTNEKTVD
jgi:hypothetical protein